MSKALDDWLAEEEAKRPDAVDAALAERAEWLAVNPRDVDGQLILPGAMVQYTEDNDYPWTTKRWGIACGLIVTPRLTRPDEKDVSIRVATVGETQSNDWFCDPVRLRVLWRVL